MTERGKPAQMLAHARQRIVAELDKAQQARANLQAEVTARYHQMSKWTVRSDALLFALDALGPAPAPRGRKRAANGTERPKRARRGVVQETAAGEKLLVDVGAPSGITSSIDAMQQEAIRARAERGER